MKFFEVFVELLSLSGKTIGRTILQLEAENSFDAAVKAEKVIDTDYQGNVFSHAFKVQRISRSEYLTLLAA